MEPEGAGRRLAAIMFTDLVGSTALTARSESAGLRAKERHRALVREQVARYGGELLESPGDETLSLFGSAVDAVNCALALEAECASLPDLRLHVGIHLGDVLLHGPEVHGDGVNIAARLLPLSEGGGICISDEVQHAIQSHENVEARSLGEQRLKNVPRPVGVFSITGAAAPPRPAAATRPARSLLTGRRLSGGAVALVLVALGAWWLTGGTPDSGPIRSIAVLPLENLGSPEQEYVADGVTDALIESLARIGPELRVISRTSVMQYKGTTKPAREIADELGVTFLIEGTAQRQDDRVLIRVQLIEAREDTHRWAQSYERDLRDFFSVQREIAGTVAAEVHVALKPEPLLAVTRPVDPDALDLYLRARTLTGPLTLVQSWGPPAIELLEKSVALDPDFAEGWVQLGWTHHLLGFLGMGAGSRDNYVRAREAAQRALKLDERLGAAHAVIGHVRLWYDWDFPGARNAFERAVELGPSDPRALDGLAWYLLFVESGKSSDVELLFERLLRVAPLDVYFRANRMRHFLSTREYERGIADAEHIREFDSEFVDFDIAWQYMLLGRPEDAALEYLAAFARGGTAFDLEREAFQRGSEEGGIQGGLRATRRLRIEQATQGAFGLAYAIALHSAVIGETEEAMTWLERAYEERDPHLVIVKMDPRMDPLRSDPRFDDLLRRIGFPES